MASLKTFMFIFSGPAAEAAQKELATYFIDGGGEDMLIEDFKQKGIKLTLTNTASGLIQFVAEPATPTNNRRIFNAP